MSFEGYYQFICPEGHYWADDALISDMNSVICPECESGPAWSNLVDDTNADANGEVDIEDLVTLRGSFECNREVLPDGRTRTTTLGVTSLYRSPTPNETTELQPKLRQSREGT